METEDVNIVDDVDVMNTFSSVDSTDTVGSVDVLDSVDTSNSIDMLDSAGTSNSADMLSSLDMSGGIYTVDGIDITSNIRENLAALKSGEATVESIAKIFWINACSLANIERTPELESLFIEILTKYQEGLFDENIVINLFKGVATGNISEVYNFVTTYTGETEEYPDEPTESYYGGGGGSSSSKSKEVIVDIDYERLSDFISKYDEMEAEVDSIDITIPEDLGEAAPIKTTVDSGKSEIVGYLGELKQSLVEILNITAEADAAIKDIELGKISFKDLSNVIYDRSQSSEVRMMTESVFKDLGYTPDEKGFVTINGCKYNVKNHMFYNGDTEAFHAYFYIPQNALTNKNYNELNTYTFFSDSGHYNLIDGLSSNSVLLRVQKNGADKKFTKINEVGLATKFMNQLVGTGTPTAGSDVQKQCRNIIGGDSSYGAYSLKVAAQNGDLYQTVYCVNNAAIVNGENGVANIKTQLDSLEELKGLDGKDIFFISVPGDENLNRCYKPGKKFMDSVTSYDNSYVYSGIELICKNCPNANVYFITSEASMQGKETNLVDVYKGLESKWSNFKYASNEWANITDPSYRYHSSGHNIVYDCAKWGVTNVVPDNTIQTV